MTAAAPPPDTAATGLRVETIDRTQPLSHAVRSALDFYLENMANHDVSGLYRLVIEEVERPLFATILNHTDGNLSHAAHILGLTRSTLRKRLNEYGIER